MFWEQKQSFRPVDQTEYSMTTPIQLIFDIEAGNLKWNKDSLFNIWCWNNQITMRKILMLYTCLISYTKGNSEWIKDQEIRPKSLNYIEENIDLKVVCNNTMSMTKTTEPNMNKWICIKLKNFLYGKRNRLTVWEKIIALKTSGKVFISSIYKIQKLVKT